VSDEAAFQDRMPGNFCWGCGPDVETGLHLKSRWSGDETISTWQPRPEFAAGPRNLLFGGIISAVIDCHSIWTAIATAYRSEERAVGEEPLIWYVTGSLKVSYRKPTPIDLPLTLTARVEEMGPKKAIVTCSLTSDGEERATGEVIAIRVPMEWFEPRTH
jgi:acyl-coenzyme A thioesterase PaaI-like protein